MKKLYPYILPLLLFVSCEKQTTWNLQSGESSLIVVDGVITNEQKSHTIKLTFPVENLNDTAQPVTGAVVTIIDEDSTHLLAETPAGSGLYLTSPGFAAVPGTSYTLSITYQGKKYVGHTYCLPGISFTPVAFGQNDSSNNSNLFHLTNLPGPFNAVEFAKWEILLDWSNVAGYTQLDPEKCKARLIYYTLPTIDVGQVFMPAAEKIISFPLGTIITERRYSITADQAEYIRAMLSETNWTGGLFDSAHSNVPTNMSSGSIGYFSVCGVETVSLSVSK